MLGPSWKNHFAISQFYPVHERPVTFIVTQWQHDKTTPNFKYYIYRLLVFLTFFISWMFSLINEQTFDGSTKWPIYLTNWGYTLCTFQALLTSIMLCVALVAVRVPSKFHWKDKILRMYPVYWVVNVIATPLAFTITVIYWSIIYNAEHARLDAMNFLVHGCNSLLMFFDLWMVSHPVRILHFFYPLLLAFAYTVFTVIYFFAGGLNKDGTPYIYPILKWDHPGSTTLVCLGVMVFLLFLHMFTFFMFRLREKVYEVMFLPTLEPPVPVKEELKGYVNQAMANEAV